MRDIHFLLSLALGLTSLNIEMLSWRYYCDGKGKEKNDFRTTTRTEQDPKGIVKSVVI